MSFSHDCPKDSSTSFRLRFGMTLLLVACVISLLVWAWYFAFDTAGRRARVSREVRNIVRSAKVNPNTTSYVDELLRRARSNYGFEATIATSALGDIGDAATPRIKQIAELMDSSDPHVRREAALSLAKLGPISEPALPELVKKVASDNPSDDETWFAAKAIGRIGKPAIEYIPLLKSKIGTGAPQFDDALLEAIQRLEDAKTSTK